MLEKNAQICKNLGCPFSDTMLRWCWISFQDVGAAGVQSNLSSSGEGNDDKPRYKDIAAAENISYLQAVEVWRQVIALGLVRPAYSLVESHQN